MNRIPFLLLFSALFLSACADSENRGSPVTAEEAMAFEAMGTLPSFSRPTLLGDSLRTESFNGRITVLNFWATWCGPCVIEIPEFVALKSEWADRPFEIVGVSMDEEGFDLVGPFAEDFHMNYPQILDIDGSLADELGGVYALPTTFVIDAEGSVIHSYMGLFPMKEMRESLDKLVEELESAEQDL